MGTESILGFTLGTGKMINPPALDSRTIRTGVFTKENLEKDSDMAMDACSILTALSILGNGRGIFVPGLVDS